MRPILDTATEVGGELPGVLDGNGAIPPAGDIADVGLRQAERLREGHLRHFRQRHGLRHAVGTRFRAKDRELLLGEHLEWNYTCETFATFSTACRGRGQRRLPPSRWENMRFGLGDRRHRSSSRLTRGAQQDWWSARPARRRPGSGSGPSLPSRSTRAPRWFPARAGVAPGNWQPVASCREVHPRWRGAEVAGGEARPPRLGSIPVPGGAPRRDRFTHRPGQA